MKLNAQQLRLVKPTKKEFQQIQKKRRELYLLLDNIYDTYNVGGMFRLADAVGAKKMFLCGRTECPPNSRVFKASVGTDKWVDWEYHSSAEKQILKLKSLIPDLETVAIEQSDQSIPLKQTDVGLPLLLIVGNETDGISTSVLNLCDQIIELPMYGINKSLNVIVSAAMVLGKLL